MRLFGKIVLIGLAAIGGLTVLGWILLSVALLSFPGKPQPLPQRMVLAVDLSHGIVEALPPGALARFSDQDKIELSTLVQAIDRASRDPRVTALLFRLDGPAPGLAITQQLRDSVEAFRKSGKHAYAYAEDLGGSTSLVYLASAFQEVWLQPSGEVGLKGVYAQSPFFKGTLALLGIEPQFGARWEYKSAIETLTRDKYSKENRESLDTLVGDWTDQMIDGIAQARGLEPDAVKKLMDKGPLLADEALEAKLVDKLGYWDELYKVLGGDGSNLTDVTSYAARLGPQPEAVRVALIVGTGAVVSGGGKDDGLDDTPAFAAGRMTRALRDAVRDPSVKAILLRIDSGGGSYVASDTIWREVINARATGKPVVVSMGDVAASGAYFVGMAGDKVIAEPATITGSIGVFSGKLVFAGLWEKLGVTWDEVHRGDNSGMDSAQHEFSPAEWARLNTMLDHIYADFTDKAAKARKLDPEKIDAVARGRIWPGDRAKDVGLIDETGGYEEAFAEIRKLARLPSQMPLELVPFPHRESPLKELMKAAQRGGELPSAMSTALLLIGKVEAVLEPFTGYVEDGDQRLAMPPIEVR